jgi:secreted trypsin-like serine protease
MKFETVKKIVACSLPVLACFSTQSWAVKKGALAHGPAYSAVIALQGKTPEAGCSAVVIHPRAFLTAAHCEEFIGKGINHIFYPDRNSDHRLSIQSIYVDPNFNPRVSLGGSFSVNDDIALVILKKPIDDATIVSHIPKIIAESSLSPNDTLMAVGLGMYKMEQYAQLGDENNSERRMAPYHLQETRGSVDFIMSPTPGIGFCGGDSGGALLRVSADGQTSELVGILTATGGICGGNHQMNYAESVSAHLGWIKANLQREGIALE